MTTDILTKLPCPAASPEGEDTPQSGFLTEEVEDKATSTASAAWPASGEGFVGRCVDDQHPTLAGRVLVDWSDPAGEEVERWVPTLQQVPVRVDDRVLLMRPENFDEPVVTGVLDGFVRRPEPDRETAVSLEVKRDESVRVAGADGTPLIEVIRDESGPVIRLLQEDVDLEFPSALRLKASQIDLVAERGSVDITANDDVNVDGELINLNC
ncbi:hypothetical protein [Salinibacter ruber]|uniref:hypothetical protein n=1 Tax=Salinibacter ruber TaxID=146919 RepID=UPI000E6CE895|nr:hypothetical protein [Salinibacter ruber]